MLYTYFKLVSYQLSVMAPSPHTSIKKQHEKPYPRWYAPSCCSTLSSHYSVPLVHPLRCTSILYLYRIDHPMKNTKKGHPIGCPQYDESKLILRWHYPNQVMGQNFRLLSATRLPKVLFQYTLIRLNLQV